MKFNFLSDYKHVKCTSEWKRLTGISIVFEKQASNEPVLEIIRVQINFSGVKMLKSRYFVSGYLLITLQILFCITLSISRLTQKQYFV